MKSRAFLTQPPRPLADGVLMEVQLSKYLYWSTVISVAAFVHGIVTPCEGAARRVKGPMVRRQAGRREGCAASAAACADG
eukprot:6187466-Pleurochrysis_carterae.AAC.2